MQKHEDASAGFAIIELVLVLVMLGIVGFAGWYVVRAKHNANVALTNASNSTQAKPIVSTTAPAATLSTAGTDNASLNSDLSSVNASQQQESSSAASANSGLNDQSSEISVPTN